MSVVLVTGANGFVGSHLCRYLAANGYNVRQAVRSLPGALDGSGEDVVGVGNIDSETDWSVALRGVDAVVHLAARVHVLSDVSADPLAAFREVNTKGTMQLAKQARDAGVRRFIYMSSIKAIAGQTGLDALSESEPPRPDDPYGRSKLEAELELFELASENVFDPVVIRPPLVYGPGVGANFLRLMSIVEKGIPMPFLGVKNRRSIVGVTNLCDLVVHCLEDDAAVNEVFHVTDDEDVSTARLLSAIADAMGRRSRLFALPASILRLMFSAIGRSDDYARLVGSLCIDASKAHELLGWAPPVSMEEMLRQTVDWYNNELRRSKPVSKHGGS